MEFDEQKFREDNRYIEGISCYIYDRYFDRTLLQDFLDDPNFIGISIEHWRDELDICKKCRRERTEQELDQLVKDKLKSLEKSKKQAERAKVKRAAQKVKDQEREKKLYEKLKAKYDKAQNNPA